jgi:hypothetical protein
MAEDQEAMEPQEAPEPAPVEPGPPSEDRSKEAHNWGMACHLSALAGYVIPFGNIIGPLVFWLIKKDEFPFVEAQGKEALSFQISMTIYFVVSAVLCLVIIGFLLLPALVIFNLVMVIIGAVKAANGESFRYPLCIRFIK